MGTNTMTKQEFSSFCKFAQQNNSLASTTGLALTLSKKYNKAVKNIGKRYGMSPRTVSSYGLNRRRISSGSGTFDRYIGAITGQESGGRWGVVNKTSGALGRYQFMPNTLKGLGYKGNRQQFLSSPQLQNKYMHKFTQQNASQLGFGTDSNKWTRQQYKYLAAAHYGGVGGARKLMKGNHRYGNTNFHGKTPYGYVNDIDRRMKWN